VRLYNRDKGRGIYISVVKRRKVCEFIKEQLRKKFIRLLKLPQTVLVFFVGKKDGKKHMV